MSAAHEPEGIKAPAVPEQGTEAATQVAAENSLNADDSETVEEKVDVSDLRTKVEDPTVGNADEPKELHDENEVKHDTSESETESRKVSELTQEDKEMIAQAQAAYNAEEQKNPTPKGDGNVEALIENLNVGAKHKAPQQEGAPQGNRFPLGRKKHHNKQNQQGGGGQHNRPAQNQQHAKSPATPVVVPAVVAPVAAPAANAKAPATVQNVTPVPPPEDAEVAELQAQAARSNAQSSKRASWSPETSRKVGYGVMVFVAVLLAVWGLSHLLGDSENKVVPPVPVEVAKVTPPAPTANQVLLDKLQQMDNRLAEALPSQADLAMLDDNITEAENAAVAQIAHVPCFKDPNQERCRKAVNAERVYYDSDFSHPRDVALGKIPYEKPADKPAPKKASKKAKKK